MNERTRINWALFMVSMALLVWPFYLSLWWKIIADLILLTAAFMIASPVFRSSMGQDNGDEEGEVQPRRTFTDIMRANGPATLLSFIGLQLVWGFLLWAVKPDSLTILTGSKVGLVVIAAMNFLYLFLLGGPLSDGSDGGKKFNRVLVKFTFVWVLASVLCFMFGWHVKLLYPISLTDQHAQPTPYSIHIPRPAATIPVPVENAVTLKESPRIDRQRIPLRDVPAEVPPEYSMKDSSYQNTLLLDGIPNEATILEVRELSSRLKIQDRPYFAEMWLYFCNTKGLQGLPGGFVWKIRVLSTGTITLDEKVRARFKTQSKNDHLYLMANCKVPQNATDVEGTMQTRVRLY